jgi:hypothetical protein
LEIIAHEHKKQLHDRILERCTQLYVTLGGLEAEAATATCERARAVEEALAALKTHLSGGWDTIDESEAAALTRWLESSRFLVDDAKPEPNAFDDHAITAS